MQCPECNNEMEKGFLENGLWIKGELKLPAKVLVAPIGRKSDYCIAWKCSSCGKIELRAEVK